MSNPGIAPAAQPQSALAASSPPLAGLGRYSIDGRFAAPGHAADNNLDKDRYYSSVITNAGSMALQVAHDDGIYAASRTSSLASPPIARAVARSVSIGGGEESLYASYYSTPSTETHAVHAGDAPRAYGSPVSPRYEYRMGGAPPLSQPRNSISGYAAERSKDSKHIKGSPPLAFQLDRSKLSIMGADGILKEAIVDSRLGTVAQASPSESEIVDTDSLGNPTLAYSKKPRQVAYKPYTVADYNDRKQKDADMLHAIQHDRQQRDSLAVAAAGFASSLRSGAHPRGQIPRTSTGDPRHARRSSQSPRSQYGAPMRAGTSEVPRRELYGRGRVSSMYGYDALDALRAEALARPSEASTAELSPRGHYDSVHHSSMTATGPVTGSHALHSPIVGSSSPTITKSSPRVASQLGNEAGFAVGRRGSKHLVGEDDVGRVEQRRSVLGRLNQRFAPPASS